METPGKPDTAEPDEARGIKTKTKAQKTNVYLNKTGSSIAEEHETQWQTLETKQKGMPESLDQTKGRNQVTTKKHQRENRRN